MSHRHYKVKDYRFGQLTQMLREKVGLRQQEVATELEVSVRTIRHWEGGTAYPTTTHLKHLIELYLRRGAFVSEHEQEEAKTFWEQAVENRSHPKVGFDETWFDLLLARLSTRSHPETLAPRLVLSPPSSPRRTDWGEAMDVTTFYGREPELTTLSQWTLKDQCQLVLLLGMGGVGKSTLAIKFAQQMSSQFTFVFWHSLRNAPSLMEVVDNCLQLLTEQHYSPQNQESSITLLFDLLRNHRCLLVLDNMETLLQKNCFEGRFREEYEEYHSFIQKMAQIPHQSCLLLTSREMPGELEPLIGMQSSVRALKVFGLGRDESQELLKDNNLFGTDEDWNVLIKRNMGNPLTLKMAATTMREMFSGSIAGFLKGEPIILYATWQLFNCQFERLSRLEQDLLYWLAIARGPLSLEEIRTFLKNEVPMREVLAALQSLSWRCLIERATPGAVFTLQAEILRYVSERLVEQICEEVKRGSPELLLSHALIRENDSDYLRESQMHIFIQPLLKRLVSYYGNERELEGELVDLTQMLKRLPVKVQGYGKDNVANLLTYLRDQTREFDFSHLLMQHPYLQETEVQDASFAG